VNRLSWRTVIAVLVLVIGIALDAAGQAAADGPPSSLVASLTSNGRVIWNLDALLNDTFGDRVDCFDSKQYRIFSVPRGDECPSPEARYQLWDFTFLNAFHSQFRLMHLAREPFTGVTNVPIKVGSDYVSCPDGEYHHGNRGWLVMGGGAGPTGQLWCD
jgi:hypothetical protein